jgi:hypothetical protein
MPHKHGDNFGIPSLKQKSAKQKAQSKKLKAEGSKLKAQS